MPDETGQTPPTLLFIFGPNAVGKMRVAEEVAQRTGSTVLHNHKTIDFLTDFFEFGSDAFKRLNDSLRMRLLEELAEAGREVAATGAWRLDVPEDKATVDSWCEPFLRRDGCVHFVELRADLQTRLARNRTAFRMAGKKLD